MTYEKRKREIAMAEFLGRKQSIGAVFWLNVEEE
jgi:hypothetical protein